MSCYPHFRGNSGSTLSRTQCLKVPEQSFDPSSDAHLMLFQLPDNRLKTCLELNKPNTKGFRDQVGQTLKPHKHQGLESAQKGGKEIIKKQAIISRGSGLQTKKLGCSIAERQYSSKTAERHISPLPCRLPIFSPCGYGIYKLSGKALA